MESCTGCVRLPLQPLLAKGCSLQFALSGYVVNGTSSFLRLPYGLTQGSCVQGLLPMVSFGCCICCLCQAVAAQERDPVGVCVGGYGVAKLLGCSVPCALSLAPPKFCYGSRCSYGPYPGAFCQVWAGSPTLMMWMALGALHKLSPQPVFCWEWGRIICHTVLWGKKPTSTHGSSQAAEHRAGCYHWQLPSSLAQGPADVGAWLLK